MGHDAIQVNGSLYCFYSVGTSDMPQKDDVIRELVARMELYPSDTVFYLNTWTWG